MDDEKPKNEAPTAEFEYVAKAKRQYLATEQQRDIRLSILRPRERAASLEHEIRLVLERQRLLTVAKAKEHRLNLALDPHQQFRDPVPRKGRRHNSGYTAQAQRRSKHHHSRRKSRRISKTKRNSIKPIEIETVVIAKKRGVQFDAALPELNEDEEAKEDGDEDSSSSSETESEPEEEPEPEERPVLVAPVEEKLKPNIWWHYHHKDGRRDNIADPDEPDVRPTQDCESLHQLRNAKIKEYMDDQHKKVQRIRAKVKKDEKEIEELAKKVPQIKRERRMSFLAERETWKIPEIESDSGPIQIPEHVALGLHRLRTIKNVFLQHTKFKRKNCCVSGTNVYTFVTMGGHDLFRFTEEGKSSGCFGFCRRINYSVYNGSDDEVGALLQVYSPCDNLLGFVHQKRFKRRIEIKDQAGSIYAVIQLEPADKSCGRRNTTVYTILTSLGSPRGRIRSDWDELPNTYVGLHFPDETSLTVKLLIMSGTVLLYDNHFKQRSILIADDPRMKEADDQFVV